ncbi:hypothetical protein EDB84DRAFT_1605017 [Lactarius hengduanensis]|nr:hypothetical protein EDB84DRAFT_1605017 [Lactarius hengduanensis]
MPVPDPPDLAALARGPSPSTQMRPRSLWMPIRQLALRGDVRDTERRFTHPKPCARWRLGLASVGGNKGALIARLDEHDASSLGASLAPQSDRKRALCPELAEKGAHELEESFKSAACGKDGGEDNGNGGDNDDDSDNDDCGGSDGGGSEDGGGIPAAMDTTPVSSAKAWIDNYILQARRKSGRQTEKSVLSLWKQWVPSAITAGVICDVIVDADHSMAYLKYTATRRLLTTMGQDQHNSQRLSSASLKKIMTMLGRVRRRQVDNDRMLDADRLASSNRSLDFYQALMVEAQCLQLEHEDFDVSENTILDSQLFPEHFEQVTRSIFTRLDQLMSVPSIIKAHFSWTWQCTTLNRGNELVNLLLNCLQPYQLSIPEHMPINGRRPGVGCYLFGVLSLYYETKVPKPGVRCSPPSDCAA